MALTKSCQADLVYVFFVATDDEEVFLNADLKLSKYAPKQWIQEV